MIKEIREHYSIPQGELADYLGITRSQLSMAESGRRSLSTKIMLSLLPFYTAISKPKSKHKDEILGKELNLQKEEVNMLSERKAKENGYKLPLLEKRLSKMKEDQARSTLILATIQSLIVEAKPKEKGLLHIIETNARQLQRKTGVNAQWKLELQIQQLKAEISYLKKRSK